MRVMRQIGAGRGMMAAVVVGLLAAGLRGGDWARFRGPGGAGTAAAEARVPTRWDGRTNMAWRTALPGPGASSPVALGEFAYVTCYSGYGVDKQTPGDIRHLERHLICVRLSDGGVAWTATVKQTQTKHPEQVFDGYITAHGYASSTPAVDESGVYVFYGTMGLFAYDHAGKARWHASCGANCMAFGSAASPILYKDLIIVNAEIESAAIIAFHKRDGTEAWRYSPGEGAITWCTPIVAQANGHDELVCYGKPRQLLGLDPASGKLLWSCETTIKDYQCPSFVSHDGVVYAIGDYPGSAAAVRLGGRGDVTGTHKLWTIRKGSQVSSPVYCEGHLYWATQQDTKLCCVEAASGKLIYEQRLDPPAYHMYASPVLAGGNLYYVSQTDGTYVVEAKPAYRLIAHNVIADDKSIFNGSPAVCGNRLLLRSNRYLYCIATTKAARGEPRR